MRKIIFLMLLAPMMTHAQAAGEETSQTSGENKLADTLTSKNAPHWTLGLSFLQWNESLRLEQSGVSTDDYANFNGLGLTIGRTSTFYRWGYSFGGLVARGVAGGGGNTAIPYSQTRGPWTMMGIMPRGFYRISGRINFGITTPVTYKQIAWPEGETGATADSGKKLNIFALFDMNVRLLDNIDLYQGIGPIGNGTFWQIGLGYRL